jgi:hypothetical protein
MSGWKNSGSTGALSVNTNHIFATTTARDAYFTDNPSEKTEGVFISVGAGFEQLIGGAWVDKTAVVTGPQGEPGVPCVTYALKSVAVDTLLTITDNSATVNATASAVTITLPAANTCTNGQIFNIKKIDASANLVTIMGVIDNAPSINITESMDSITVTADVANNKFWII